MQVERFSFKEFSEAAKGAASRGAHPFRPHGKSKAEETPPPPPPTFSEEELKSAERDGYKKGFLEGTQEGRKQAENEQTQIASQLAETAEKFVQYVQPLVDEYRKMALQTRQDMPKIALAIAKKVAGKSLAENAQPVIAELAQRACETMIKEPKLTITVHESLGDALARQLEQLTARLQAASDIVILRDPNISIADCRIEWEHGCMERKTEQIWQQIEKTVENMSAAAAHDKQDTGAMPPATPIQKE